MARFVGSSREVNRSTTSDGQCIRLMGVLVDVTARKLAEEEIHRLKERLEAENVYLRAEVSGVHRYGDLVGRSEGTLKVLRK